MTSPTVVARAAVAALTAAAVAGAVAGCDDFRDVKVENGCDARIEVSRAAPPSGYGATVLRPGGIAELHSSGGPFDVVVRTPGSTSWSETILWADMEPADDEGWTRSVVVEGVLCP